MTPTEQKAKAISMIRELTVAFEQENNSLLQNDLEQQLRGHLKMAQVCELVSPEEFRELVLEFRAAMSRSWDAQKDNQKNDA